MTKIEAKTNTKLFEDALENVLLEIVRIRREYKPPEEARWTDMATWDGPLPSDDMQLQKLASPTGQREMIPLLALQWIGGQIHIRAGTALMRDVLEIVAGRNPQHYAHMQSICNAWWDGTGDWVA